jgi:hypothetical protein
MKNELNTQIDMLIAKGNDRFEIWKRLKNKENKVALRHSLNNKALSKDKRRYRYLNIFLSLILLFVTIGKILGVVNDIRFARGMYVLIFLIEPAVNMYILKEIVFFKRTGYQFLFIISVLSLLYQGNREFPAILFTAALILISAFLYMKIFSKKNLIPAPANMPLDKKR